MKIMTIDDLMKLAPDPDETFKNGKGNCELCGKKLVLSPDKIFLSIHFRPAKDPDSHKIFSDILISCPECEVPMSYDIPLERLFDPEEGGPAHWMAHLTEKTWLTPELALKFFKAMYKLQELRLLKEG